jgi:phosphatidate cytidylyltransferase
VRRRSLSGVLETAGGAIYVGAPAALFLWLRAREPGGFELIILLFASIWAADVAAYFAGRLIGGPKLMSWLSPQKTWAGLGAGIVCGTMAAAAAAVAFDAPVIVWGAAGAGLALVGLMGDLFESFLKRRFGVKDASHIIPGHGGVLDRLDGLMAATLFAAGLLGLSPGLLAALMGGAP